MALAAVAPTGALAQSRFNSIDRMADRAMRAPPHLRAGLVLFSSRDREFPVRAREVVAIDMTPSSRATARRKGFTLIRSVDLDAIGLSFDILRPPAGMSVKRALKRLRRADPDGVYEPNSIFDRMGSPGEAPMHGLSETPASLTDGARLGLIDTAIHAERRAFTNARVTQKNFGRGDAITPREHGTMVAALSLQYGVDDLFIADTFSGDGAFSDAEALARALNWMAAENVAVINMSLAGPPNTLLEKTVARMLKRGHTIVAAVGNDGPSTPPQYPAGYPSVIGVTAVDKQLNIYKKANQGETVDIATIGVDIDSIAETDGAALSGTSYATPAVSAFIAQKIRAPAPGVPQRMSALVEVTAIDIGAPGRDPVFGAGYLSVDPVYKTAGAPEVNDE